MYARQRTHAELPRIRKPNESKADARRRRARLDTYMNSQGWADLRGQAVALCQQCGDATPRRQLRVVDGRVLCRQCASA